MSLEEINTANNNDNQTKKKNVSTEDYRVIIDIIHEMDEQCKILESSTKNIIEDQHDLHSDVINDILQFTKEDIPTIDISVLRSFLASHANSDEKKMSLINASDDEIRNEMLEIKDASLVLLSAKEEAHKIKDESSEALEEYFNFMSSDRVNTSRKKRLDAMKKALELENNETQKKEIQKMINTIESAMNFDFLEKRFSMFGDREIESIEEGFFDGRRGSYVIDRYMKRIEKFGFNPDLYKYFINIEENFLNEKYSPYNNLFLFIYMRMVAYADPYDKSDKLFVQSITGALASLIYHKFDNSESEYNFIKTISNILDHFEKDRDRFIECNTTYEKHPMRIKAEEEHTAMRKKSLIESMDKMGIKGYDSSLDVNSLQEYYNNEVELMKKQQLESYKNSNLEIDGAKSLDPSVIDTVKDELNNITE